MKLYVAKRQEGKTTMLIKQSAQTGAIIVVATKAMAQYVKESAKKRGLSIPDPISIDHYIQILAQGGPSHLNQKYLLDDLQTILIRLGVDTATIDENTIFRIPKQEGHFHAKLTQAVKDAGQDLIDNAEAFVGEADLLSIMTITLRFDPSFSMLQPTIDVDKEYICKTAFERLKG